MRRHLAGATRSMRSIEVPGSARAAYVGPILPPQSARELFVAGRCPAPLTLAEDGATP